MELDLLKEDLRRFLAEDLGSGDITSAALIPPEARGRARVIAKQPGVICGAGLLVPLLEILGDVAPQVEAAADGQPVAVGTEVARARGGYRQLLAAERTYLNLAQRLSGIATLTRRFADALAGTKARVLDTRKTNPGLRALDRAAVRAGGGFNHRFGLYDEFLIKENHLAPLRHLPDAVGEAVARARRHQPGKRLTIEVRDLEECARALAASPDCILLDNMGLEDLRRCVALRNRRASPCELEASGGITLANAAAVAATGVERLSVGALTHSAPALDLSMLIEPE